MSGPESVRAWVHAYSDPARASSDGQRDAPAERRRASAWFRRSHALRSEKLRSSASVMSRFSSASPKPSHHRPPTAAVPDSVKLVGGATGGSTTGVVARQPTSPASRTRPAMNGAPRCRKTFPPRGGFSPQGCASAGCAEARRARGARKGNAVRSLKTKKKAGIPEGSRPTELTQSCTTRRKGLWAKRPAPSCRRVRLTRPCRSGPCATSPLSGAQPRARRAGAGSDKRSSGGRPPRGRTPSAARAS